MKKLFKKNDIVFTEIELHSIEPVKILETGLVDEDGFPKLVVRHIYYDSKFKVYEWDISRTYRGMRRKLMQRYWRTTLHSLKQMFSCRLSSEKKPFNRHYDWFKEPMWWDRKCRK